MHGTSQLPKWKGISHVDHCRGDPRLRRRDLHHRPRPLRCGLHRPPPDGQQGPRPLLPLPGRTRPGTGSAGLLGDGHHRAFFHRHQQPPTQRRPPIGQLLRDRHLPDDDLPLGRHPPRRGRLRRRRRADLARGDPAGHPGPGRQRLHPRPYGGTRAGFSATTELDRGDFGITTNVPLDGGGVVIGDRIQVFIEIEAVLNPPQPTNP